MYVILDILFRQITMLIKVFFCGLCFWAADLLIDKFYKNLLIKGSGTQKQNLHKLLRALKKKYVYLMSYISKF